jgi:hypothetical protein
MIQHSGGKAETRGSATSGVNVILRLPGGAIGGNMY